MEEPSKAARSYVDKASARFRRIYESLGRAVREIFPHAEASFESRMPGWKIPRRHRVDPKSEKGTVDPNWVQILLVERKSGITLHLWNPVDVNGFRRHQAELERAGFKLMAGSLQFNRKSEYPIGLVVELLKDAKKSLEEDERRGAGAKAGTPAPTPVRARSPMNEALRRQLDDWASEPPMDGGD